MASHESLNSKNANHASTAKQDHRSRTVKSLKGHIIILLCFGISLTERFTQASIPLVVNHMGLTSIEMSLFLSAMAASTVFTGLVVAPYIDTCSQRYFSGMIVFLGAIATLSFLMFSQTQALGWGCFLTFCIGTVLRIINFRRLSVINSSFSHRELSRAHTRMQLSITAAMAFAPLCLTLSPPEHYLSIALAMLLICIIFSAYTSSASLPSRASSPAKEKRETTGGLQPSYYFIFIGMLLSGIFLSALLMYCQSISDRPEQLYAHIIFSQVIGLIAANMIFERFFGERFKKYSILILSIALAELAFIFTTSSTLVLILSCLIGFSFQIMFLRSHNQFQQKIPPGLSARLNGIRGLYTFSGITTGYILGPFLFATGGIELVFVSCSVTALFFFSLIRHLSPQGSTSPLPHQ